MTGRLLATTGVIALAALGVTSGLYQDSSQGPVYASSYAFGAKARAARALAAGDYTSAIAEGQKAVGDRPLDQASLSMLGVAYLGKGDNTQAYRTYAISALLGWRDPLTQHYWIDQSLRRNAAVPAAQWLDATMRIYGMNQIAQTALPILESADQGRAALLTRALQRPSWLFDWVRSAALLNDPSLDARTAVVDAARQAGVPLNRAAAAMAAANLFAERRPQGALAFWQAAETEGAITNTGLWDDDFSRAGNTRLPSPFEWRLLHGASAEPTIESSGTGNQLRVSSFSSSAQPVATQTTLLPPGPVRLTWKTDTASGMPSPLYPRVKCTGGATLNPLASGQDANGQWIAIIVPSNYCPTQTVTIWFDPGLSPAQSTTLQYVRFSSKAP